MIVKKVLLEQRKFISEERTIVLFAKVVMRKIKNDVVGVKKV
jgi:hypothetical protein